MLKDFYSQQELLQILQVSHPTLRAKIKDLNIKKITKGKYQTISKEDALTLAKSFEKNVEIFSETFIENSENNKNKSLENSINKEKSVFNENNEIIEEYKTRNTELKNELSEVKAELKETREDLKVSNKEYRKMADIATDYQEKHYESRKLLQEGETKLQNSQNRNFFFFFAGVSGAILIFTVFYYHQEIVTFLRVLIN